MEGFIQLHRQLLDWEWYDDINVKVLFIHILLKANWSDKQWRGINIKQGQFLTGRIKLAEETGLTQQQVRTSLKKLESTRNITIKTTNRNSIIEVINYKEYQQSNQQTTKQITTTNIINKTNKNNNNNIVSSEIVVPKVTTLENYIKEEFTQEFINNVKDKYNISKEQFPEECNLFLAHWKEKSPNWKKERWEKEKTFDPKLRFYKWMSNYKKWNTKKETISQQEKREKLEELKKMREDLFSNLPDNA